MCKSKYGVAAKTTGGTGESTQKICTVYDSTNPNNRAQQGSGWSTHNHWHLLMNGSLPYAPAHVAALLKKIADNVQQIEKWPVGVCAEMWCLLRGLELQIQPKNIRIEQASGAGGYLLAAPCRNCAQWLEAAGSRVYKLKDLYVADLALSSPQIQISSDAFPPLPTKQ